MREETRAMDKIDNVYEVIMNNSHEYYQKAKKRK